MGLADCAAGTTPVIPFALLPFDQARVVCIGGTAVFLVLLGIGGAKIGKRPATRTLPEMMAIATIAANCGRPYWASDQLMTTGGKQTHPSNSCL